MGRVDDGTTVTDFDPDEIERKISLQSALAFCEWKKAKINLLDTPGYANFLSEARAALRVVDAAHRGRRRRRRRRGADREGVGLRRRVRTAAADRRQPHGPRERVLRAGLRDDRAGSFGRAAVPVAIPIGQERGFKGVVDLVAGTALTLRGRRQRQAAGRRRSRRRRRTLRGPGARSSSRWWPRATRSSWRSSSRRARSRRSSWRRGCGRPSRPAVSTRWCPPRRCSTSA